MATSSWTTQPDVLQKEEGSFLSVAERAKIAASSKQFHKLSEDALQNIRNVCGPNCTNIAALLEEKVLPCLPYCLAFNSESLTSAISKIFNNMPTVGRVLVGVVRRETELDSVLGQGVVRYTSFRTVFPRSTKILDFLTKPTEEGIGYETALFFNRSSPEEKDEVPVKFVIEVDFSLSAENPALRRQESRLEVYLRDFNPHPDVLYRIDLFNQPQEDPIVKTTEGKWPVPRLTLPHMKQLFVGGSGTLTLVRTFDLSATPAYRRYPTPSKSKRKTMDKV